MNIGNALPIEDKSGSIAVIIQQIPRRKSNLKTGKNKSPILNELHGGREKAAKQNHAVRKRRLASTHLNNSWTAFLSEKLELCEQRYSLRMKSYDILVENIT